MKLRFFDVIAIIFSLAVFLAFTAYGRAQRGEEGYVIIEDSQSRYVYPLSEDRSVTLHGPVGQTIIRIENGEAFFLDSDCDDKLCVQMGHIHRAGDWSACLPNQVFVYTGGKGEGKGDDKEVDAGVY